MSRCELTGKGPVVKNLVSHSNIKTKFLVQPNIQKKQIFSTALNRKVTLMVATSTLRTMEHQGSFDGYLLNQPDDVLSKRALKVKSQIKAKLKPKKTGAKNKTAVKATKVKATK